MVGLTSDGEAVTTSHGLLFICTLYKLVQAPNGNRSARTPCFTEDTEEQSILGATRASLSRKNTKTPAQALALLEPQQLVYTARLGSSVCSGLATLCVVCL